MSYWAEAGGLAGWWCQYSVDQIKNQSYKLSLTARGMLGRECDTVTDTNNQLAPPSTLSPPQRKCRRRSTVYWSLPPRERLILIAVWSVWSLAVPLLTGSSGSACFHCGQHHPTIPPIRHNALQGRTFSRQHFSHILITSLDFDSSLELKLIANPI